MVESLSTVAQGQFIVSILPVIYGYGLTDNGAADSLLSAEHVKRIALLYHRLIQAPSTPAPADPKDVEPDLNPFKSRHLAIANSPNLPLPSSRPITYPSP